ncbi:MAG: protein adenylyltransferase SelO family protein, partial [Pseudomonadota bacterium]
MTLQFDNSYARLPSALYTKLSPEPVKAARLAAWNEPLAAQLGLDSLDESTRAAWFSGNDLPPGADPLAQAYSGHQFGHWSGQLGDGRAVLLGEVIDR